MGQDEAVVRAVSLGLISLFNGAPKRFKSNLASLVEPVLLIVVLIVDGDRFIVLQFILSLTPAL